MPLITKRYGMLQTRLSLKYWGILSYSFWNAATKFWRVTGLFSQLNISLLRRFHTKSIVFISDKCVSQLILRLLPSCNTFSTLWMQCGCALTFWKIKVSPNSLYKGWLRSSSIFSKYFTPGVIHSIKISISVYEFCI